VRCNILTLRAMWGERICSRFETAITGFKADISRLRYSRAKYYATASYGATPYSSVTALAYRVYWNVELPLESLATYSATF